MSETKTTKAGLLLFAVGTILIISMAFFAGLPIATFDYQLIKAYWFHNGVLNYQELPAVRGKAT